MVPQTYFQSRNILAAIKTNKNVAQLQYLANCAAPAAVVVSEKMRMALSLKCQHGRHLEPNSPTV